MCLSSLQPVLHIWKCVCLLVTFPAEWSEVTWVYQASAHPSSNRDGAPVLSEFFHARRSLNGNGRRLPPSSVQTICLGVRRLSVSTVPSQAASRRPLWGALPPHEAVWNSWTLLPCLVGHGRESCYSGSWCVRLGSVQIELIDFDLGLGILIYSVFFHPVIFGLIVYFSRIRTL